MALATTAWFAFRFSGAKCSTWNYMGYPNKYYDIGLHTWWAQPKASAPAVLETPAGDAR